jgi:hypothetical protein
MAVGTPLAAETLWGHVAWGICYRLGRQALESWLDRYDRGDPPLVLSVNRLTGGTAQLEGGTLFTANQRYYDFRDPPSFDVWCLSPEPCAMVERWLVDGLAGGYGRDASAGLGNMVVTAVEAADLPAPQGANAVVLLGSAVPKPGDPSRGFFRCGVHSGRLGGDFAIGELPGGATQRQKRPVNCLLAGTVFVAQGELPQCVGRVLRGVHPQIDGVRHFGMTPVLPCRLADEVMERVL